MRSQAFFLYTIPFLHFRQKMNTAIYLDNQASFPAIKVGDKSIEAVLSAEFDAELPIRNPLPKHRFRMRWVFAQFLTQMILPRLVVESRHPLPRSFFMRSCQACFSSSC
jgi:hypothetical protein